MDSLLMNYDPNNLEIRQNPYPFYKYFREQAPIHWNDIINFWLFFRHDDINTLSKHPLLSVAKVESLVGRLPLPTQSKMNDLKESWVHSVLFLDPPVHTRLRNFLNKAFTPKVIKNLQSDVEVIVNQLIQEIQLKQEFDLVKDFAYPLPVIVMSSLLGVPVKDRDLLKKWSDDLADILGNPKPSAEIAERANGSVRELNDYFRTIIAEKKRNPTEDFITQLISAQENQNIMTYEEVLASCSILLLAGHETTTNLIGNGMLTLLSNPDAEDFLRNNLDQLPTAVEEFLRYDSSVQFTTRKVLEDFEYKNFTFKKGQSLMFFVGSANRDPEVFSSPDEFIPTRTPNKHLSFGSGIHFCVGAALARMESYWAFKGLLGQLPKISLDESPQWKTSLGLRGLKSLRVKF